MVRLLLLASFLLLGVGTAGAAEELQITLDGQYSADGYLMITKESIDKLLRDYPDAYLRVKVMDDPCLAKMEAAMRAMDMLVTDGVRWGVKSQERTARTLWQDTKRECWAKP